MATSALAGIAVFGTPSPALANPTSGQVAAGQAVVSTSGQKVTIQQSTSKAIFDWSSFDIAPGETTQFQQPSSFSIALNRINDVKPSSIEGQLTANGTIILLNPNGILFGKGAQVDVGSIIATTSGISDTAFMTSATPTFDQPGNPNAQFINQGTITAAQAGLVGLVAPNVENSGTITAKLGKVQLVSGDTFTLDLAGDGVTQVGVSDAALHQLVRNDGAIAADGGTVQLSAAAARNALDSLIVNTGVVQANSVHQQGGKLILSAATPGSTITNSGRIRAQGLSVGESGGSVSLSASAIQQNGSINVSGESGGTVSMKASSIAQNGTIQADGQSGPGGTVNISFGDSYTDSPSSVISASSISGPGGLIQLSGTGSNAVLSASGTYTADSQTGPGGQIILAANTAALGGTFSAQGGSTGGTITVNAATSYAGTASTLLTAASAAGTGGTISIEGGDNANLTGSGVYVSDGGTTGGAIDIFSGNEVMLLGAYLSSRGSQGGGTVRIGGDYVGTKGRRRASFTDLDQNTLVLADATNNGTGGQITLSGTTIGFAGKASAQGGPNGGDGGSITLFAPGSNAVAGNTPGDKTGQATSTVLVSGLLDAAGYGPSGRGGTISVLADDVGILSGAFVDASGDIGGGTIKIGGDFHGAGSTPTALNTYVDPNSLIFANANTSSNGGDVTVWADGNTYFYGNILAEGGKNSGNGGFVETSGHGYLDAQGYVDLTAPNGNKGTYLLDPATIEIYGGVTPAFNATDASISLSANLKLWLDASDTSNVNLTYNSLGTTATGSSGANTITVSANTSLVVGARIRIGGAGSVTAASTVGADTYTISNIAGTTITLSGNLTSNYSGSSIYQGYVSQLTDKLHFPTSAYLKRRA